MKPLDHSEHSPILGSQWSNKTAAVYRRVSTEEQTKGAGLEVQKERCLEYCKQNRLRHRDYCENPLTHEQCPLKKRRCTSGASIDDREVLQQLLNDANLGKFQVVLVHRMDRLARSSRDLQDIYCHFKELGISLVSVTEPFDATTLEGKLMFDMVGSLAEWERGVIKQRTMAGMRKRVEKGRWKGGPPPYGYRKVIIEPGEGGTDLEPNPAEKAVVLRCVELFIETHNISYTARTLNTEGHRTRKGKEFAYAQVKGILTGTIYRGVLKFGDLEVVREDLQMVDDDIYYQVQGILASMPKRKREKKGERELEQAKCQTCGFGGKGWESYCPVCGNCLYPVDKVY